MQARSPGPDKQPVSSSEKHVQTELRGASAGFLLDGFGRPKGQEDVVKATNDYQIKESKGKHVAHFPENIMRFHLW